MVAEAEDGPRGKSSLKTEERDRYSNLILLCRNHHSEIDGQEHAYSVEVLKKIKKEHEAWVVSSLPGFDGAKQQDDEIYAGYIDEWARRCDLDSWMGWSSGILGGGQPSLSVAIDGQLRELRHWLLVRVWPGRYPKLEKALQNFRCVLADFQNLFHKHAERLPPDFECLYTKRFYKIEEWDEERYDRLSNRYEYHVDLVQDLMLELTRAANHVCDEVRAHLLPGFRLKEGRVAVESGPHEGMQWHRMVVQYDQKERSLDQPYPGLPAFVDARTSRDRCFGQGPETQEK